MTITKSKGSSLPFINVSVDRFRTKAGSLTRKLTRESLDVECSRATSLMGLFIDRTFESPATPGPDDPVSLQMSGLKQSRFPFSMKFLQDFGRYVVKIYYHNIQ
jgi:hypothetical protein